MKKKGNVVLLGCGIVFLLVSLLGCKADPQMYSVTFDSQEGSDVARQTIQENGKATRPADPTKDGYVFDNWHIDSTGGSVWDFGTAVTGDIKLYAKWVLIPYIGDAGGYVFYDKGSYSDGWRYLEAAPAGWSGLGAVDPTYIFGYHRPGGGTGVAVGGTNTGIGTGKANTAALVAAMGATAYSSQTGSSKAIYAAKACADYSIEVSEVTYEDWFLPSKEELTQMYINLHRDEPKLGGFSDYNYWSSSERIDDVHAFAQGFSSGNQYNNFRGDDGRVRPVRAF